MPDPGLMPLPDSASDLDWSNLVDAAKAFEGKFSEYNTQEAGLCACFIKDCGFVVVWVYFNPDFCSCFS